MGGLMSGILVGLGMLGCIEANVGGVTESVTFAEPGEMSLSFSPETIDFGVVPVGAQSVQTLTVRNDGEDEVFLTDLWASAEDVELTSAENAVLPGTSQQVRVYWQPGESGEMSEEMTLLAGTALSTQAEVPVALSGVAEGPEVYVSLANHDFGGLSVGCSASIPLSISNVGTTDLTVARASLSYEEEFILADRYGDELPPFPWLLAPGEGQDLTLTYLPDNAQRVSTTLEVISDDPLAPSVGVQASGSATIDDDNTDVFDVTGQQNITIIVAVNDIVKYYEPYRTWYEESLSVFFQTLQGLGPHYRVAFHGFETGELGGSRDYIDDSLTPSAAAGAAMEMLEGMPQVDNDYQFRTLSNALAADAHWVSDDEDTEWRESKLNLLGINNDIEQSGSTYVSWLADFQGYREVVEDVVVHGIGGPAPSGCQNESYSVWADPMVGFHEAAAETGGLFLSVCEPDWASHMESLAVAMLGRNQAAFELTELPSEASIEVSIGGFEITEGWSYNADVNAIVFDEGELPEAGSLLEVYYLVGDCDD